jgi:hypothetical protein
LDPYFVDIVAMFKHTPWSLQLLGQMAGTSIDTQQSANSALSQPITSIRPHRFRRLCPKILQSIDIFHSCCCKCRRLSTLRPYVRSQLCLWTPKPFRSGKCLQNPSIAKMNSWTKYATTWTMATMRGKLNVQSEQSAPVNPG